MIRTGSYITLYFHWHGNFATLLLLGILALGLTALFIPYKAPEDKETISFKGYIPLFQSDSLMLLMINIIFMFVPYWIFVGISPLLYMKDLHVSLIQFGYYQGILALVFAVGSVLFGLIMHEFYSAFKRENISNPSRITTYLFSTKCFDCRIFLSSIISKYRYDYFYFW